MSGIEVPIKYGSNDGVTVRIYFIDLTEGGGIEKLVILKLSTRVKIIYHSEIKEG
jgi:hypothetical protein